MKDSLEREKTWGGRKEKIKKERKKDIERRGQIN